MLCLDLLQRVLGIGSRVPHGAAGSKLGLAASAAAGDAPVHVSAINMSYAGSGLFGFTLAVDSSKAGEVGQTTTGVYILHDIPIKLDLFTL